MNLPYYENFYKEKGELPRLKCFGKKNAPVKVEGNLMFSQRNNPYCDLLLYFLEKETTLQNKLQGCLKNSLRNNPYCDLLIQ